MEAQFSDSMGDVVLTIHSKTEKKVLQAITKGLEEEQRLASNNNSLINISIIR